MHQRINGSTYICNCHYPQWVAEYCRRGPTRWGGWRGAATTCCRLPATTQQALHLPSTRYTRHTPGHRVSTAKVNPRALLPRFYTLHTPHTEQQCIHTFVLHTTHATDRATMYTHLRYANYTRHRQSNNVYTPTFCTLHTPQTEQQCIHTYVLHTTHATHRATMYTHLRSAHYTRHTQSNNVYIAEHILLNGS